MYCRFCGEQIDDDSVFCIHCGKKLTKSNNATANTNSQEENTSSSAWILLVPLPFIAMFLIIFVCISASSGDSGIITRDLRSSDYTYTTQQDLTSYRITVTPKRDIDNCDIQLTLYDSSGDVLYSDTISKTDLKEGSSYTYVFDFGFVSSLSGSKVRYTISGKCK